jgi:colicin import membrane protein
VTQSMEDNDFTPHDKFTRAVLLSVAAHILLVAGFTVRAVFFPSTPLVFENAVRVDLVALPDKLTPEPQAPPAPLPAPAPAPVAKPEPPPVVKVKEEPKPDTVNLAQNKKQEKDAFKKLQQKLKAQQALEKIQADLEAQKRIQKAAAVFKGNQISKGSELTGLSQLQYDNYVSGLKNRLHANWTLPEWLAQKKLDAQALVRFDDHGNIVFKQIVKSSGNPSFDELVLSAIQKSSPLPAPPAKLAKLFSSEGLMIGFPE